MLAHWEQGHAELSIGHQGQFPSTIVSFNLAPGKSLGDAVTPCKAAEQRIQMPASINASFQGTAAAFQTSLANEPILILAALITVYIVLGVLYESYIHPITIISTLPSAGVGALLALLITRVDFSVIALIGMILLIGIVQKNAIMMIDFALQAERDEGKTAEGRDLPGLPAALPADHYDHHGRAAGRSAAGPGRRRGRRAAHAAGRHHCRRPDLVADAHALYHAGRLSLLRQAGAALEAARTAGAATRTEPVSAD